jgi:hypothetical protein
MATPIRQSRDLCPLLAENFVFAFIKTKFSLGLGSNA